MQQDTTKRVSDLMGISNQVSKMHKYLTKVICCQQNKDATTPFQVAVIPLKLVRQLNDKRNSRKTGLLEKRRIGEIEKLNPLYKTSVVCYNLS